MPFCTLYIYRISTVSTSTFAADEVGDVGTEQISANKYFAKLNFATDELLITKFL